MKSVQKVKKVMPDKWTIGRQFSNLARRPGQLGLTSHNPALPGRDVRWDNFGVLK
jgi:hypothetical protein